MKMTYAVLRKKALDVNNEEMASLPFGVRVEMRAPGVYALVLQWRRNVTHRSDLLLGSVREINSGLDTVVSMCRAGILVPF